MNLFLRIVLVFLRARRAPRIGLLDPCITPFRVWFTDQDMFRHMTNSRYFSLTDVCIVDYMLRAGAWPRLRRKGWLPVVVYEDMILTKMLRFPHKFQVRTRLEGWDDKHAVLSHVFLRRGKVTAEGFTVARFVDRKGERIATAEVLSLLEAADLASPPLAEPARAALARAQASYGLVADNLNAPLSDAAPSPKQAHG